MTYEPQEDSFFLKTFVRKYAKGNVLDIGTGSGIQAVEAYNSRKAKRVWGTDIDAKAIAYCKKACKKITWLKSDLFSAFKEHKWHHFFDTIIFNPPYLPQEGPIRHKDLEGGKRGNEGIIDFLEKAARYLKPDGKILLLFSSLSAKQKIFDEIDKKILQKKLLGTQRLFFEELYVYMLTKKPLLNELNKKGITKIKYLAQGKRGIVFTGEYKKKKVAIKTKKPESEAKDTIAKEAKWLKEMNKHGIGPKYLLHTPKYLVYKFVEGQYLRDLIGKRKLTTVLKKLLDQAYKMDKLGVEKKEMTRPLKNAIVKGQNITLIDFERMHEAKPHNVTQLCQFLITHSKRLKVNRKRIMDLAKKYDGSKEMVEKIKKEI